MRNPFHYFSSSREVIRPTVMMYVGWGNTEFTTRRISNRSTADGSARPVVVPTGVLATGENIRPVKPHASARIDGVVALCMAIGG